MVSDAEGVLREKLKVALKDARTLFDEGLLDEKEFKDLKAHELGKYKEQLAAVTSNSFPKALESTPPEADRKKPPVSSSTPLQTPVNEKPKTETQHPLPTSLPLLTTPTKIPANRVKATKNDVVYVDANTYQRLTTPPIFRRRSRNKRKIVIPCAELRALQGLREENTNLR